MKFKIVLLFFMGLLAVQAQTKKPAAKKPVAKKAAPAKAATASADGMYAIFETSKGNITVKLEYQKAPVTVANFVSLVEGTNASVADAKLKGKPYYDGLKFHRVIKDFMIQGGDPQGTGQGGPGYAFKDEFVPDFKFDKGGILAMANSGPATNGSQFFITHKETPWLTNKHTIFGYVTSGQDVVNKIEQNDVMTKVRIERKGAEAKKFDANKIFADYMVGKPEEDRKMAEQKAKEQADREEARKKQAALDAENKRIYDEKYAPVKAAKVKELADIRKNAKKSDTGFEFASLKPGNGTKPADGQTIYFSYAGYLEDGTLFDSSYEDIAKEYGKWDEGRAKQNGYNAFPYQIGNKSGLIAGFIEGLGNMSFNERAAFFIPANLGYGAQGAGGVIPPNSNIIFIVEMFEAMPATPPVFGTK
ncbi:peptidylprolyl isomerase [Flavobacterium caeni]|uniref:peptidylprolyl isomerase n=1 Tax=Flavobacterium caeni TaxID=490189 RepID=A0A1G5JKM3_9FLAO|nr:peptidylprolyl isomerase [Flavobacterium caeni]SCY88471.1 Peptidyl-prolyl cis-trans isomerase (rotamase)-cyclophilin family [Flavobacterium caeni]